MPKPIRILFLCVANSARSQLAEGLAKSMFGNDVIIESAGSEPSGKVQPWAIEVLKEDGIDISKNRPKSIDELPEDFLANLDYVITLCSQEICPVLPSAARRLHWPIKDPACTIWSDNEASYRVAKSEIRSLLTSFKKGLRL